jgi:hypothetical protein
MDMKVFLMQERLYKELNRVLSEDGAKRSL